MLPQVTRDYDEEEQGYDSEKEREDKKTVESDDSGSSPVHAKGNGVSREANHNGDEHHGDEDDMEVSDWWIYPTRPDITVFSTLTPVIVKSLSRQSTLITTPYNTPNSIKMRSYSEGLVYFTPFICSFQVLELEVL